jgi:GT2 family glycosyltransferase
MSTRDAGNLKPLPLVSAIVVTFNNERQISRCIESLLSAESTIEIIIVDNASTDRTIFELTDYLSRPRFYLVRNRSNIGFPAAVNIGVAKSTGSLVFLLNPDAYLQNRALIELTNAFRHRGSELVAQPKILRASDPTKIDSTGDFVDLYGFAVRRGADPVEVDSGQYDDSTSIFSARGAALMTSRSLFNRLGGMDGDFFVFYEDVDFCWRARMVGAEVVFVPGARVLHEASAALSARLRAFYGTKNRLEMLVKDYQTRNLLRLPPAVIMALWISVGECMRARNVSLAFLRLKGLIWVLLRLPAIWKKRMATQRIRLVADDRIESYMLKGNASFLHWVRSFLANEMRRDGIYGTVYKESVK